MKYYMYLLSMLAILGIGNVASAEKSSDLSLDRAIDLIQQLDIIRQEMPHAFSDARVQDIIHELYLFAQDVAQEETHHLLLEKIATFQELATRYTIRAPRIGALPEQHVLNVDPRYIDARDEYLRNLIVTGSLIAPNFQVAGPDLDPFVLKAGDTMTGNLTFANQHGAVFNDSASDSIFIQAPAILNNSYTLQLPVDSGIAGQVLATSGSNPDQLFWTTINTMVTGTLNLFGDVIGSTSATVVKTICGADACSLVSSITTATSANICGALVMRDSDCNFSANNITANLTGTAMFATNALLSVTSQFAQNAASANFAFTTSTALTAIASTSAQFATSALTSVTAQYATNALLSVTSQFAQNAASANFAFTTSTALTAIASTSSIFFTGNLFGDVTGTQNATVVSTLCGVPACNVINTFSFALSGTSADTPLTLVLRDSTGSFSATTITLTGALQLQGASSNLVSLQAPSTSSYTLVLPVGAGTAGQVLTTAGTSPDQLTWSTISAISTLTVASLTVDNQNGAIVAVDGLYTAMEGNDGTRLASFPLTSSPHVNFFQPVEPSRESYLFDDFISFNASTGDQFYGDTPWIVGNTSLITSQTPNSQAIGITRLTTGTTVGTNNYLIKQLNGLTRSQSLNFGNGPCLNEWHVSIPVLSTPSDNFTCNIGMGDNPTGVPNNGIFFSTDNSIGGGQWIANTNSSGGNNQLATGVFPVANIYQRLQFQVDSAGKNVTFFINDIPVGTSTIGIPTNADTCSPFAAIINSTGSGGSVDLDYWYFHYIFKTQR